MRSTTEKYLFEKRLVTEKAHYINAKLLGSDLETISEFNTRAEANEALPAIQKLYPDHTVFVSLVCTTAWSSLEDNTKAAVMDVIEDLTLTVIGASA